MFVNVKGLPYFLLFWVLVATAIVCPRAGAQQFQLSVAPSAKSILAGTSLKYTISVTNVGASLADTFVTNILTSSQSESFTPTVTASQGTYFHTNNTVVFELGTFYSGNAAQMTLTVTPTMAGQVTNSVTVADPLETTNIVSTNVVVQVTNAVTLADLGVTMIGPKQVVITNDWITYGVAVTNAGPNAATGVMLTNIVPPGVIGITSTNQNSGTHPISLGTLMSGSSTNLIFLVEPTNAGVLPFSASITSTTPDTNSANNAATTNIAVTGYLPGTLAAVTNSSQSTNFTLGLLEQSIVVSNIGTSSVPAVRLVLTGLTNRLYNAVGTNNGNPFVYCSAALPTNQSVNLLLQYLPRRAFPFTNSQLQAFAVPMPDWSPPSITGTGTNININRILQLTNGNMFIDWPSVAGKTYTVVYSDNMAFSNSMIAPPSIVAGANDTGWIDYGPPTTTNAPANSTLRFYRVYQNP